MEVPVQEKKEKKQANPQKVTKGGVGGLFEKYKSLFGGSLFLAVAVHLLLILGFGSYTLFKGSAPSDAFYE